MSGKLPLKTFISLEDQQVDCSDRISLRMLFKETVPRVERCIIIDSVADNTKKIYNDSVFFIGFFAFPSNLVKISIFSIFILRCFEAMLNLF
jgi:hypothetical protein